MIVTIYDIMFSHNRSAGSICHFNENLIYSKNIYDIGIYTDYSTNLILQNKHHHKINVAWIIESPRYSRYSNLNMFDYILTHDENILNSFSNSVLFPIGGCWVPINDVSKNKNNLISIIASNKNETDGQRLRHDLIKIFKFDVFGRGYFPIDNKNIALDTYKFSVIIENCSEKYYFSEKLIDCFISKTIPIYFGAWSLPEEFDKSGILYFSSIDEFSKIYENLNNIDISDNIIQHNFEVAKKYCVPEDRLLKFLENI